MTLEPLIGQLAALEILDGALSTCWPTIVRGVSMVLNTEKSDLPLDFYWHLPTAKRESVGRCIYSLLLFFCLGETAIRVS
ncbi:MAG: hypothetical protein ACOYLN_16905, partial [Blastocatellia bacterium]